MLGSFADIVALAFAGLALGATVLGRLPQRQGVFGLSQLRTKGAIVGAGVAVVPATALAYEVAGAGVLPWLWLGCLLGVALLGRDETATEPGPAPNTAKWRAQATALTLALAGAWLIRHSAGLDGSWLTPLLLWGVGALTIILAPPANLNPHLLRLPALLLVGVCVFVGLSSEGSGDFLDAVLTGATDFRALAGGTAGGALTAWLALVVQQGLLAGAHSVGLGYTEDDAHIGHARELGWAAALNAMLLSGALVFALDASHTEQPRLDDANARAEDGRPTLRPVERPHNRAYLPSPEGQSIVLPADTTLEADKKYRARFHANPRGYKIALYSEERGAFATAKLNSTAKIDTIYFRDKDPARAKNAAWDLRVPVKVEELDVGNATPVLQFTPEDESVDLRRLEKKYDGPYLPIEDVELDLVTRKAISGAQQLGAHLAALSAPQSGPTVEFTLDQIVPMGFRGPFFDLERPHGPLAFLADPALDAELGDRIAVEYRAPESGLELGHIDAKGTLTLPGWNFLESLDYVVFHHESGDPSMSFLVPIVPDEKPLQHGMLRFVSPADAPTSLHKASKLANYVGPFLPVGSHPGWVEVRSGKHLADGPEVALGERGLTQHAHVQDRVLVPLGADAKGRTGLYEPPVQELIQAGYRGPYVRSYAGTRAAGLGGLGLLAAWLLWAFAAWVALPGSPLLRLVAALGAIAGLWLPFKVMVFLWVLAAAKLALFAWPRRARE